MTPVKHWSPLQARCSNVQVHMKKREDVSLHGYTTTSTVVYGGRDLDRELSSSHLDSLSSGRVEKLTTMCELYRVSSSLRLQQMEAELSQQLSALRMEVEQSGFLHRRTGFRCGGSQSNSCRSLWGSTSPGGCFSFTVQSDCDWLFIIIELMFICL